MTFIIAPAGHTVGLLLAPHHRRKAAFAVATIIVVLHGPAGVAAQRSASEPGQPSTTISGSLRTRVESWDWFGRDPNGTYTYSGSLFRLGFSQSRKTRDWQVEVALPLLLGLPTQPPGTGPRGLGANYFAANDNMTNASMPFVKQATLRIKDVGGVAGQSLKFGRMEFFDGAEVVPKNATLAAVKRDRVAQRLLGNFAFTHVGRSLDGVQYAIDRRATNFTFLAARPTRGVFQVNGWGELNVNVFYGNVTRQVDRGPNQGEWRAFALQYSDYRDRATKTDNRPLARRQADGNHVNISTFGGHYLHTVETSHGPIDWVVWGAVQTGSWGGLAHRAGAVVAEAGWQPKFLPSVAPWIRGGFDYGSGDHDPNDARHGTFFQILPTPRVYARFPFFNMMNTSDGFGELTLRPSRRMNIRTDVHVLGLADRHDLWYQGGGAFQQQTFGYVGVPSNQQQPLATLSDVSADFAVTARWSVGGYYGRATGGSVLDAIYATDTNATLAYVELLLRF